MDEYDWDRPWVLGKRMESARLRCLNIAEGERILGYDDNYHMYRDMAEEFKHLAVWAMGLMYQLPPAA